MKLEEERPTGTGAARTADRRPPPAVPTVRSQNPQLLDQLADRRYQSGHSTGSW